MATITFDTPKSEAVSRAHAEAEAATKTDLRELECRPTFKLDTMRVMAIGFAAILVKLP